MWTNNSQVVPVPLWLGCVGGLVVRIKTVLSVDCLLRQESRML